MIKKYLNEISISGLLLLFIGAIIGHTLGAQYGAWPCGVGLLLGAFIIVYKACHWKEYERDNKRNIVIMLGTIILLYLMMLRR